jgi:hypothetical protein
VFSGYSKTNQIGRKTTRISNKATSIPIKTTTKTGFTNSERNKHKQRRRRKDNKRFLISHSNYR